MKVFIFVVAQVLLLFFISSQQAWAQSCGGGTVVCGAQRTTCNPVGCNEGIPGCSCTDFCDIGISSKSYVCSNISDQATCQSASCPECGGSCSWGGIGDPGDGCSCVNPDGALDQAECSLVRGWACDRDHSSRAIDVEVWVDGRFETSILADDYHGGLANSDACEREANHAFNWTPPNRLLDGRNHDIYFVAVGVTNCNGECGNKTFGNRTLICSAPTAAPTRTPTPTACVAPVIAPSNLSPNGGTRSPGTIRFSWGSVIGATRYPIRINDLSTPGLTCGSGGDYCNDNVTNTFFDYTVQPGRAYSWWVHAGNVCGAGPSSSASFIVSSLPPTAGPSPTAPQVCVPGTFSYGTCSICNSTGTGYGANCSGGYGDASQNLQGWCNCALNCSPGGEDYYNNPSCNIPPTPTTQALTPTLRPPTPTPIRPPTATPRPTSTPTATPTPAARVSVIIDTDEEGDRDIGESFYLAPIGQPGARITLTTPLGVTLGPLETTSSRGYVTFSPLPTTGRYTATLLEVPSGYRMSAGAPSQTGTFFVGRPPPIPQYIFFIVPLSAVPNTPTPTPTSAVGGGSISGKIFEDLDGDGDISEDSLYTGSGGNVTVNIIDSGDNTRYSVGASGSFATPFDLPAGVYRVEIAVPSGYRATYPPGSLNNYIEIRVGPGCPGGPVPPGTITCVGDNATEVNFGIIQDSGVGQWFQGIGGDVRVKTGNEPDVPVGSVALLDGAGGTPGVLFSFSPLSVLAPSRISSKNWNVVNLQPILRTTYARIMQLLESKGATPTPYTGGSPLSSLGSGVYRASSNLTLSGGSTISGNKRILLLVNGNLTLENTTTVTVDPGSSLVVVVGGSITVKEEVGMDPPGVPITGATARQLDGFYIAEGDFDLRGTGNPCPDSEDKILHVGGGVIVRGRINTSDRTLCDKNADYPVLVVSERVDMILNTPLEIVTAKTIWREIAP